MSLTITPDTKMEEILQAFPSAQRALFQRYHVGGCSACAFQPTDTLGEVCRDHNILDVNEVVQHILRSDEMDRKMQIDPAQVREWSQAGEEVRLIDVRMPAEREGDPFPEAEELDFADQGRYMGLPKESRLIFACQDGGRSLDVAAYFAGHGFTAAYSLRGGHDAWKAPV